jgi:hypothetical protein
MSMRRVLLAVAALAISLAHAGWAGSAPTAAPSLRLVSAAPLTLRGTGFLAQERVRLTLSVRAQSAGKTVRADALGRFTYRPQTLIALDPCRGTIVVSALGLTSGLRATWKRACRPPDVWPPSFVARRAA